MVEAVGETPADTIVSVRVVRQCHRRVPRRAWAGHPLGGTCEYREVVYMSRLIPSHDSVVVREGDAEIVS